jgi:hypothetical protein
VTDLERQLSDMMHSHAADLRRKPFASRKLIRRAWRRRLGTAAVTGVTVIALALGGVTLIPKLASSVAPSSHAQETIKPRLLPPLCGHINRGQPPCPTTTAGGDYRSELVGITTGWPFTFTLPDGWRVRAFRGGQGLDLIKTPTVGMTVLAWPTPLERKPPVNPFGPARLVKWVSRRPMLNVTPAVHTTFGGMRAWQVDVDVRSGARGLGRCRIGAPTLGSQHFRRHERCLPLFRDYFSGILNRPAIAPLSGKTGRLIFIERGFAAVVWVWNLDGVNNHSGGSVGQLQQLLESFHFGPRRR